MTRTIMVLIAVLIVPLLMLGGDRAASVQAQGSYCATEAEADMLGRINAFRQQNGLVQLTLSQPLGAAATLKSRDMASQDYFAHISPGGLGPRDVLDQVGYPANTSYGENLASGNSTAAATFEQWVNSPSHRSTMLGSQFTAVGIGVAYDPDSRYGWYWTTIFGGVVDTPAGSCGGEAPAEPPVVTPVVPPVETPIVETPVAPPAASPVDALIAVLVAILARILAG
jgi:uncharacterized protein YkwD